MSKIFTRLGVGACSVILSQVFVPGVAKAVPTDVIAWSSLEQNVTVYKDAVDNELYWFIPQLRFEAKGGKTVIRPSTLANGKVQYITRIIPYFTRDMRELVANNLSNVRQDSQLRPVVAKNIGISLPDFGYKFVTEPVTNYQYLDVPRLVRFQLEPEEAALFDELYADELGITTEFMISYDGMMTDKFYNIEVSCKQMKREIESGLGRGTGATVKGKGFVLGADLQTAFLTSVQNSANGINVVSKGDLVGMQEMLRRVMNTCFDAVDSEGYPIDRYDPYRDDRDDRRDDEDDRDDERNEEKDDGLLPKAALKVKFKYKSSSSSVDNQSVVKQVSLKDSTSTTVIMGKLALNSKSVETVTVDSPFEKKLVIGGKNSASAPLMSGVRISDGQQFTINAELVFKAATIAGMRTVTWDSSWPKADGDLYYRIGSGSWTPVNRRAIITSDVARGGGELQFYIDRSAIFNKIPEKLRTGNIFVPAKFTASSIAPEFSIQVTGRKISVK